MSFTASCTPSISTCRLGTFEDIEHSGRVTNGHNKYYSLVVESDCFCGLCNQEGKACSNEGSLRTATMDSIVYSIVILHAFCMAISDQLTVGYGIIKHCCMFACLVKSKILPVCFSSSPVSVKKKDLCEIKGTFSLLSPLSKYLCLLLSNGVKSH